MLSDGERELEEEQAAITLPPPMRSDRREEARGRGVSSTGDAGGSSDIKDDGDATGQNTSRERRQRVRLAGRLA